MARSEKRGRRGRANRPSEPMRTVTGPGRDPEDDIREADERGEIRGHRPRKSWIRGNIRDDDDEED